MIGRHEVGNGRCFIIGEVGLAHDGSLSAAHAFIDAIAWAGADCAKFQMHLADHEPDRPMRAESYYRSRHDQWRRTAFDHSGWASLRTHAELKGMEFLCSPFSLPALGAVNRLCPAIKIASGEIANRDLLVHAATLGKPILLSAGMATETEIKAAIDIVNEELDPEDSPIDTALLQCTSAYPCPPERVGLNLLSEYREKFRLPLGLSDHSGTIYPGLAAVTLGCDVLEVHVKLSEWDQGPDASSSLTPEKLKQLVEGVRFIETMKAHPVDKDQMARELQPMRELFMRQSVGI